MILSRPPNFPRISFLMLALVAALPITAAAGPATQADIEAFATPLVEAIATQDATRRRELIRALYRPEVIARVGEARIAGQFERIRTEMGVPELHRARGSFRAGEQGAVLHAIVKMGTRWHDLQFVLAGTPLRVEGLVFIANVAEPVTLPAGRFADAALADWVAAYAARLAQAEDLSGGVLVARGETVIVEHAFGFRDAERRERVTTDTRFSLASGGKMLTALLVARAVEQGRLSFDAPLSKHLAELKPPVPGGDATVAQLLSHTAGFGEYWTESFNRERARYVGNDDLYPLALAAPRTFAPGAGFEYSNSNFVIAGVLAERALGRRYDEALRQLVLNPAAMNATTLAPLAGGDEAVPLIGWPNDWKAAPSSRRGSAAGGAYSTTHDMLRLVRALKAGKIVKPATFKRMITVSNTVATPRVELSALLSVVKGADTRYGLGFILEGEGATRSWGHGGIATGVNFELRHFPASDLTVIVWSNQDNGAYDDLKRTLLELAGRG